ncbi:T-complex protein 1 subunit eta [Pyricularia oryzae 70-15]|uniref:T-complex protein 1 subunit eta n=3 Tax=Pyricularia oryzae TaxID=318829 RepID=G4N987_PYRO7|nr:T-complex protein 1 subunit eta [Pyricularia oryzae 70-15]EHA50331.1 T-complex protein 1 subunit eta [Pyricularia oryzae 70-15]ELQ44153.1 T-complex protein 1 subunit eta [Pyricularia oryzae Y34]KAI7926774.1 T-complex protein 1 subunit eta [Pyricularia oryzae]KAI7928834.1 T-complex protein 1 subunit eta [Pyricularia oryzae]
MSFGGQTPTIIVLKEGTDSSQGKGQIVSNINACLAVQATIKSTLGPYGGDLLMVDANGKQTITNDGATVMKLLDIVHPAARVLVDIARSQDAEVGDGTTSVVVLAGEILKEIKEHVEQGVSSQIIVKGLRRASSVAVNKIKEIAVSTSEGSHRETLTKLAGTAMTSKLIKRNTEFFTKMVVDAVLTLDQEDLNEKLIGIKKIPGGSLTDSLFVNGVAFKKTFSYAGFEQQPKSFKKPKIVCLNVELELKAEKDNAEVRVEQVSEYQAIVDAEWQIIFKKLEAVYKTGAKVVLSKLPIGDLATQYFADRDIFCAGRVASEDMERVVQATGATVQSTCSDILPEHLGTCGSFEERQIGGERFNFFEDCPEAKTCTLVLRGGAEQFIAEVERSLHDAIMIVKRAIRNRTVVAGGGAVEMEVSAHLHRFADLKNQAHKQQAIIKSFAKALEIIPRQLCDNAGFDATDILNKLRVEHRKGNTWAGVDFQNEGVADLMERFVWEPALIKINAIQAATEACCLILSVDETIRNEESAQPQAPGQALPPGAAQRALRGRGRGMPRR